MKRWTGILAALVISGAAWGQEQDLEVTMEVVPPDVAVGAVIGDIKLPAPERAAAHEAAAFGLETANRARQLRDEMGEQFGQEVSKAARERARERFQGPVVPPKPPAP